jgi:hypothetical protein
VNVFILLLDKDFNSGNVLQLGDVADFEVHTFNLAQKFF